MNLRIQFFTASAIILLSLVGCGEKLDRPDAILSADQKAERNAQFDAPVVPSAPITGGVMHYTCPNGHAGASAQGMCASCGATLVHNQAFHNQAPNPANSAAAGEEPPQNASGVWHYTCPNGHAGGSGSATPCPECGSTLIHNTTYHDQAGAESDAASTIAPTAPTPEPAQNAIGVWHYTCPNGHAGGEGSAVPCAVCGTTLVHNTVYHE